MKYLIALDLKGLLVELNGFFNSEEELKQFLHDNYESFKDQEIYIIEYDEDKAVGGGKYKFDMDTYYACEDGVYTKEAYDVIDEGLGIKEIGATYLVNTDLLPEELEENSHQVSLAIERWIYNFKFKNTKPNWLI